MDSLDYYFFFLTMRLLNVVNDASPAHNWARRETAAADDDDDNDNIDDDDAAAPATCSSFLSCTTAFFIRINHEALFDSPLLSWKLVPFTMNEVPRPYKCPEYLA